jgi:hypothetical protein
MIKTIFGRLLFADAEELTVAQPGSHEQAPVEAAVNPAILRKSLLVCLFITPSKT